ncbi:MAG TPA: hypothetical protein VET89_08440 [Stellaceae bacterium]|jgi:hypothetical protein|nr:hypothetical protein [Stellaceae bacterium]
MSELGDALVMLERAVTRLEAVPRLGDSDAAARLAAERAAEDQRLEAAAAAIVARVEAALDKIGQVLGDT